MTGTVHDKLYSALLALHDEQVEYIRINNLGLPHQNATMQQALIALTLCRELMEVQK